jgi:hypothetical protein
VEVHEVSEGVILSGRAPGRSPEQPSGHFTTKLPCKGLTRSHAFARHHHHHRHDGTNKINKLLNTFFDMIIS